jgi:hypothetical protein
MAIDPAFCVAAGYGVRSIQHLCVNAVQSECETHDGTSDVAAAERALGLRRPPAPPPWQRNSATFNCQHFEHASEFPIHAVGEIRGWGRCVGHNGRHNEFTPL